jgi:hypothetical protein
LRIHDLRHTAVALWIAAGANLKEVSARGGYASVRFTLDRYGHLYPEPMLLCATAWRRSTAPPGGTNEPGRAAASEISSKSVDEPLA